VRTLVNFFAYNDDLAAECGVLPDWRALFETNRALWWIAVTAPFHQCLYLINDPSQHAYVAARLEHYRGRTPRKFQVLGVLGRAYYEGRRARQTVRRLLGRA
jgi:hypothetical protein